MSEGAGGSLEFFVNYACSAKCPFCFNPPDAGPELERGLPFDELAKRLYAGYRSGYRSVKFIGGEATVRDDLPKLIGLARRIGYGPIQLTTNGLRLAERRYARRLASLGADTFRFSVHGPTGELHDRLVGVPGALAKVEAAVGHLKELNVRLGINTVLCRPNVDAFPDTCRYFHEKLGIDDVLVYFLRYQGFAALPANAELLALRMSDAVPRVREAFSALRGQGRRLPELIHFPPCAIPELAPHMLDWTSVPEGPQADRTTLPDGASRPTDGLTSGGKRPVAACRTCRYSERCAGVEANYLERFGDGEFSPVPEAAVCA
jgi:MoaA/NifB/PqqE/SkfB family radical SAM enzyme